MLEWFDLICRWVLGLQLLFWGLNGFFHWVVPPSESSFVTRFGDLCAESRFIMPTVKVFEILFGALLLTGYGTLVSLIFLGPIIFVITGLHFFHNPKWWRVVVPITGPYILVLLMQEGHMRWLLH
jgi:uncharacterized membrane protein YphA (DoxX/SURF4 family)